MLDHATDVIPLLLWMIIAVGGALIYLIVWIGRRLQKNVDEMPEKILVQVEKVHSEILHGMTSMASTHKQLERDLRGQLTEMDRRLVRVETRCDIQHVHENRWEVNQ